MGRFPRCSSRKVTLTSTQFSMVLHPASALSCSPPFRQEAVFRRRASDDHRRPGSESNPTRWSKKVGPTAFSPRGTRQGLESKRRWNKRVGPRQRAKRIRSKSLESRLAQWTAYREMSRNLGQLQRLSATGDAPRDPLRSAPVLRANVEPYLRGNSPHMGEEEIPSIECC